MKTVKEIQLYILQETGLKTSVKKGSGSMKGYMQIWPKFQDGNYPKFPFDFVQGLINKLHHFDSEEKPIFCTTDTISVYLIEDDRINFKNEAKPKERGELKTRTWGSKNSQLRLDKKAERYAKNFKAGKTGTRYW